MKKISELWDSFQNKTGSGKSIRDKLFLLVLSGLLLLVIVWPVSDNNSKEDAEAAYTVSEKSDESGNYEEMMEQRLKRILGNVEGAGEVQVMITVKSTAEQVVEKDETYSESRSSMDGDENSSKSRSESTIYDNGAASGSPYVVKEIQPEVEGVFVVAEGADDETVVNEITHAVQVLFDVPVHKIKVAKMSSR